MTDHLDVPIVATGDWIDAAWINQFIGDNYRAWAQGFANVGSIPYAIDGNTVGELTKPASLGLLTNNNLGTLAWLTGGTALQVLRKNAANNALEWGAGGVSVAYHNNATGHTYGTNAWRDMPNSSKSITVAVQSTIVCMGFIEYYYTDNPNHYGFLEIKFNIDGTDIDWGAGNWTYPYGKVNVPVIGLKTGVAAGSKTIKLREICDSGSYGVDELKYLILVIPEG